MRTIITCLLFFTGFACFANMASPIRPGTSASAAFGSRNIDILKEVLQINIDSYNTARFTVDYFINTDTAGKQIPLLFYAQNYAGDFTVWVDDIKVPLADIPAAYRNVNETAFAAFANAFNKPGDDEQERTTIAWSDRDKRSYRLNDLKYFEAPLNKGRHHIHVTYTATSWENRKQWVKEYSFPYSLSPAKYWRSFGGFEVIVNGMQVTGGLTTNLGTPANGSADSIATFSFSQLPGDVVLLTINPSVSNTARALINLQPEGIAITVSILLALLHFMGVRWYRKAEQAEKYSPIVIAGSIIIPLLMLGSYVYAYSIIDDAIGEHASHYHGYTFLIFLLYPLLVPVYWLIMWLVDRAYKKKPELYMVR